MTFTVSSHALKPQRFVAGALVSLSLGLLASCGGSEGAAPTDAASSQSGAATAPVVIPIEGLEKTDLKFGFIKLTDMAPLAIAYEKGYFEEEGLFVTLEPQANWKVLLDRVIDGELDGAHMLAERKRHHRF